MSTAAPCRRDRRSPALEARVSAGERADLGIRGPGSRLPRRRGASIGYPTGALTDHGSRREGATIIAGRPATGARASGSQAAADAVQGPVSLQPVVDYRDDEVRLDAAELSHGHAGAPARAGEPVRDAVPLADVSRRAAEMTVDSAPMQPIDSATPRRCRSRRPAAYKAICMEPCHLCGRVDSADPAHRVGCGHGVGAVVRPARRLRRGQHAGGDE
jgi:hypothetical protein